MRDDVVEDGGRAVVDEDAAIPEPRIRVPRSATVLDGEIGEDCCAGLRGLEGDCGVHGAAVDDGGGWAGGAGDGDGFALEVDVFVVGPGGDEDGVAWGSGIDGGLDGGVRLAGAYVECGCVEGCGGEQSESAEEERTQLRVHVRAF